MPLAPELRSSASAARFLNGSRDDAPLVVAQEAEFKLEPRDRSSLTTVPHQPDLYFAPALNGYGWCVRKQEYLNIGFGHTDRGQLPSATAAFAAFIEREHKISGHASVRWKGHAYLLAAAPRRMVDDGLLLIGDAAGLASPMSGEGIRPAVESGLIAAATIVDVHGRYDARRLAGYQDRIRKRFGIGSTPGGVSRVLPREFVRALGPWLLRRPWFVRHVVLESWFLHALEPALAAC
jgi:hypothetical protein